MKPFLIARCAVPSQPFDLLKLCCEKAECTGTDELKGPNLPPSEILGAYKITHDVCDLIYYTFLGREIYAQP